MTELLTLAEVAAKLRCSTRTVRRLIARGEIRPKHVGRRPLVTDRELEAYMNRADKRRVA